MQNNKLNIISVEQGTPSPKKSLSSRKEEAQALYERLWLTDPNRFNPDRDCMNRERIDRIWSAIASLAPLSDKKAVDLGCGMGVLSLKLRDAKATVDALDIANNALKHLQQQQGIQTIQDWFPKTCLQDDAYDLVVCSDLIAELDPTDFRLAMSELARLVKAEGTVICSTPLDINSEDALERFNNLAETEFNVEKWIFSYHRLYIRICNFFEAPSLFYRGWKDPQFRASRSVWFKLNSVPIVAHFWGLVQFLANPIHRYLKQSRRILLALESFSKFYWDTSGVSHAIFVGKRRPLIVQDYTPEPSKRRMPKWE